MLTHRKPRLMPNLLQRYRHALIALLLAAAHGATVYAFPGQPGTLDATFAPSSPLPGTVVTEVQPLASNGARAVVVQSDGKIVAAGTCATPATSTNSFCVARYLSTGALDSTFGSGGRVVSAFLTSFPGAEVSATAVAIQSDGKIVVSGYCDFKVAIIAAISPSKFCAMRFTATGALDTTFAVSGRLMMSVVAPPAPPATLADYSGDRSTAMLIQPDGKIVMSGTCATNDFFPSSPPGKFCVLRLNADGTADTQFGAAGDGKLVTDIVTHSYSYSRATALALQADGKLVVAGNCKTDLIVPTIRGFCTLRVHGVNAPGQVAGTLDASYGFSGRAQIAVGTQAEFATGVVVQPDGKIVMGGTCTRIGSALQDACAARLLANGSADTSFGFNGGVVLTTSESVAPQAIALQTDGKILLGGQCNNDQIPQFCIKRLYDNGSLDTTFSGSGTVRTSISGNFNASTSDVAYGVALQPDGKIVLAGTCRDGSGGNVEKFCVARYEGGPFAARLCSVDLDGDGRFLATTDGLIFNRVGLGLTGDAVVSGIGFAPEATRTTWPLIREYLVTQCGMSLVP
jgi:uncharacterized delta-60 repeat protein